VLHTAGRGDASLINSLRNWNSTGLLGLVAERLLYVNSRREDGGGRSGGGGVSGDAAAWPTPPAPPSPAPPPPWELLALELGFSLRGDARNVGVGPAMADLLAAARSELVLFLEKDWVVRTARADLRDARAFARYWRALLRAVVARRLVRVLLRDAFSFYEMVRVGRGLPVGAACHADPPFHMYCESPFFTRDGAAAPWTRDPAQYELCSGGDGDDDDGGSAGAAHGDEEEARARNGTTAADAAPPMPPGPLLVCHNGNATFGWWTNNPMLLSRAWFNEAVGPVAALTPGFQEMESSINGRICDRRARDGPQRLAPPHRTCVEGNMALDAVGVFDHVEIDGR
jgi:hypothetical protein